MALKRAALLVLIEFRVQFLGLELGLGLVLDLGLEPPLRSCENLPPQTCNLKHDENARYKLLTSLTELPDFFFSFHNENTVVLLKSIWIKVMLQLSTKNLVNTFVFTWTINFKFSKFSVRMK